MAPRKNPTEPTADIQIGDETYKLLFDLEAVANAEDATGIPLITGIAQRDVRSPRISMVRAMLWACLQPYHPEITQGAAAGMVSQFNVRPVWDSLLVAWVAGMKDPGEAAADPLKGQS